MSIAASTVALHFLTRLAIPTAGWAAARNVP